MTGGAGVSGRVSSPAKTFCASRDHLLGELHMQLQGPPAWGNARTAWGAASTSILVSRCAMEISHTVDKGCKTFYIAFYMV